MLWAVNSGVLTSMARLTPIAARGNARTRRIDRRIDRSIDRQIVRLIASVE